jgi:hypothetical protein
MLGLAKESAETFIAFQYVERYYCLLPEVKTLSYLERRLSYQYWKMLYYSLHRVYLFVCNHFRYHSIL